jgi:hypothetical protein
VASDVGADTVVLSDIAGKRNVAAPRHPIEL